MICLAGEAVDRPALPLVVTLLLVGLHLPLLPVALAQQSPAGQALLTSTSWSASAYSHEELGDVCWLVSEDGSLRVEVSLVSQSEREAHPESGTAIPVDLESLLSQQGDGWTMVLGPEGNGTLNAWGREWREVPAGLAQMARLIISSLRVYPDRPADPSFASLVGGNGRPGAIPRPRILGAGTFTTEDLATWRFQLSPLALEASGDDEPAGFRRRMTTRGRGTGGLGEILVFRWTRPDGQAGYGLRVVSSRRPGTLSLEPPRDRAVATPAPEAFLPLWPLSQFLETH